MGWRPLFSTTKTYTLRMMKVLVTGATGYLGSIICHSLLTQGHSVRAFVLKSDHLPLPTTTTSGGSLEIAYGDITDYESLLSACSGIQIIFHLAAILDAWLPDLSRITSVNVGGLENILKAVAETESVEKIIYTSSFFALGSTDGGRIADESQVHDEKFFCTEYEKSKAIADKIAMQAASDGVPIVCVCPGMMYGAGNITSGNMVAKILIERFKGRLPGYIGDGNDRFSFSHVKDVANGHIAAMHKGKVGEKYLLTGENSSFKDVLDLAGVLTGTRKPCFHLPFWALETYGWISVCISRLREKLPFISPPWAYSCGKAKMELGYNPRSLKEGLEEVILWLKDGGYIRY